MAELKKCPFMCDDEQCPECPFQVQIAELAGALEELKSITSSPCSRCINLNEERCSCPAVVKYIRIIGIAEQALEKYKEQK